MTAEIAIMNKSAVALAADSAVTIGNGANAKIYNTISKIFELSDACPVGIMVFNRLDYMGIPLEVLIKEYRTSRRLVRFPTILDWQDDFVSYLKQDVPCRPQDKDRNTAFMIMAALEKLNDRYSERIDLHIEQHSKLLRSKLNILLQETLDEMISELDELPFATGFKNDKFGQNVKDLTRSIENGFIRYVIINQTSRKKIDQYIAKRLSRNQLSDTYTGFVIAGFGDKEIFPSLSHIEVDGLIDNKLKIIKKNYIDISRDEPQAEILGFAQDDMVQSFVNGVDPSFRTYSVAIIRNAIEEAARLVLSPLTTDKSKITEILKQLSPQFDQISADHKAKADEFIERRFSQEVKSMVRSMPKQDLATLAESLIEITSLKRKVTRDRETVGGDVDVAVISRSEGLVWVKRKHYFPADLNARFFSRHFK